MAFAGFSLFVATLVIVRRNDKMKETTVDERGEKTLGKQST
jgi:hypothetical protein